MNLNVLGGAAAVAVLGVAFYYGQPQHAAPVTAPAPAPVATKAPAPVTQTLTPPQPAPKDKKFFRVNPNGGKGEEVACTNIVSFTQGKSESEIAALAKQYGVTVDTVKSWFVCAQ